MTGGPGKAQGTNKPPPIWRVQERSKGDAMCPTSSQNPSWWHPSWLGNVCATKKGSDSDWLAKDHQETNPITTKLETASHVAEQEQPAWVPLLCCSLPRHPRPVYLCQPMCLLRQFTSECWTTAHSLALEGVPLSATVGKRAFIHLRFSKQLLPSWSGWHTHCFLRAAPLLRPWENLPSWTQPGGKEIFLAQLSGSRLGA